MKSVLLVLVSGSRNLCHSKKPMNKYNIFMLTQVSFFFSLSGISMSIHRTNPKDPLIFLFLTSSAWKSMPCFESQFMLPMGNDQEGSRMYRGGNIMKREMDCELGNLDSGLLFAPIQLHGLWEW